MSRWLSALGDVCYRFRKSVVAVWIVFVLGLSVFAFQLPAVLKGSGFVMEGTFAEVNTILKEEFGIYESTLMLVFEQPDAVNDDEFRRYVVETVQQMRTLELEGLADTASPYEAAGARADPAMAKNGVAYATLSFDLESKDMPPVIRSVRDAVANLNDEVIPVQLTGAPIIEEDLNTASQEDLTRAEMIGLPVAMIVLLFAFGGLIAAGLPLIVGLISVVSTMGVLYFFGLQMDLSIFLLNVVVMLGLALGIDFALLFVNRFRQELKHRSVHEAVRISVLTAGESIIFSGLCVFIGLAGMMFIQVDIFKVIALGGMTVVFFSILSAITLLPALLSLLGHRVNKLMVLKERPDKEGAWLRFSRIVMKRPIIMAAGALLILIVSMIPIRDMNLRVPGTDALPMSYESRVAYETYEATFLNEDSAKVVIIAETPEDVTTLSSLAALQTLNEKLAADPQVSTVESLFSLSGNLNAEQWAAVYSDPGTSAMLTPIVERLLSGNQTLLQVELNTGTYDEETKDWVREMDRDEEGVKLMVGGYPKFNQEIFDEIYQKVGYSLALILGATYLILFIAFRSVLIPLKAILMNVLSLCATFGIIVWIFQDGLFGLDPTSIALFIPIFIFSIVFGLSTDYEVFLISRIQEIYRKTGNNDQATLEGLALTSKIITSAAAIMIVITGAFAFTGVMPVKQLGVGIALAIFIDATIVRMVLVPSMMKLLGQWNWWAPRWFRHKDKPGAHE
ncbi:MMPL family transporter [Paenibacillus abyssi]|uniref:Membrane protein n=1 Tax=Paenibacillus abyssi TaxID=1340531 RepID=A0A917CLJ1_9BACL|nr:MMPL family transporter [Paenibacillus abyssi]GGF91251.1 membrane protein [Paenibacillus abyssi]